MRASAAAAVVLGLIGLASAARAADGNKELIVGPWEVVYSDAPDAIPVATKLEFTADGKVLVLKDEDGKTKPKEISGYKVEKDTVVFTGKDGTKADKGRIVLLNKSSLVVNDEVLDKVMVFKKLKK